MGRPIIAIAGGKGAFTSRKLKQRVPHSRRKQGLSRQERRDIADPGRSRGRVTVLPSKAISSVQCARCGLFNLVRRAPFASSHLELIGAVACGTRCSRYMSSGYSSPGARTPMDSCLQITTSHCATRPPGERPKICPLLEAVCSVWRAAGLALASRFVASSGVQAPSLAKPCHADEIGFGVRICPNNVASKPSMPDSSSWKTGYSRVRVCLMVLCSTLSPSRPGPFAGGRIRGTRARLQPLPFSHTRADPVFPSLACPPIPDDHYPEVM